MSSKHGLAVGAVTADKLAAGAVTQAKIGAAAVGQGELKTALQQATQAGDGIQNIALTGGNYSLAYFWSSDNAAGGGVYRTMQSYPATSGATSVSLAAYGSASNSYLYCRYIQASPPDNLGDGEFTGFVFLQVRPDGSIAAVDVAEDSPWIYNGPNKINPYTQFRNASGVRYRRVSKIIAEYGGLKSALAAGLTRAQIMDRLMTDSLVD